MSNKKSPEVWTPEELAELKKWAYELKEEFEQFKRAVIGKKNIEPLTKSYATRNFVFHKDLGGSDQRNFRSF